MGFFDIFRRKKAEPEFDVEDLDLPEPRCHHYLLAHRALPSVAFARPRAFFGVLATSDARDFLEDLLGMVSQQCRECEPESKLDFSVDDISIHHSCIGKFPCVILKMPEAKVMAEAIYVAAVLLDDADLSPAAWEHEVETETPDKTAMRYFTLEKGLMLDGSDRTVLCSWTPEGSHFNFGDGPAPHIETFEAAIEKMLTENPEPWAESRPVE